jgi:hypothetical protein
MSDQKLTVPHEQMPSFQSPAAKAASSARLRSAMETSRRWAEDEKARLASMMQKGRIGTS